MYIHYFLVYCSWPLLIAVSYFAILFVLSKFEKLNKKS